MNNSNPFVPQGSLLEQKNKKQARVKYAVYSILAANLLLITPLLIQGCKKEPAPDATLVDSNTNPPPDLSTNPPTLITSTNPPSTGTNPPTLQQQPVMQQPVAQPVQQPVAEMAPSEYVVQSGDTYGKIAKKYNVKLKELEAANSSIPATKLKVGQKLQIPAGGSSSAGVAAASTDGPLGADSTNPGSVETYTVKAGDSLTKIAKHFGVSIKAIRHANKMNTDHIVVGKKLKIPAKAASAAPAEAATTAPAAPVQQAPVQTTAPTSPAPAGTQQQ